MQAVKKAFRTTVDKMNNANNNNCFETTVKREITGG